VLVLAELELWPNLIRAAKRHGAKVAVVNGRLSEKSYKGYRRIRFFIGRLLRRIDCIAAQDETYAGRFANLGAEKAKIVVTGSMKYDGAETDRQNPKTQRLRQLAGIEEGDIVFLAGSTQEPEEEVAVDIFKRLAEEFPRLKLIIVPRHPERFGEVGILLHESGVVWQKRTALESPHPRPLSHKERGDARVFLVDVVGELGAWWGAAQIGFVGGSFGRRGGQNMIEPAAYGVAVSFGPNTWNFRDIVSAMLDHQAAVVVKDENELEAFVRRCLADPVYAAELGQHAQSLVKAQLGATERTFQFLEGLVE
jgi:3-deoxy-D-manno-octulosonic-acid transferase